MRQRAMLSRVIIVVVAAAAFLAAGPTRAATEQNQPSSAVLMQGFHWNSSSYIAPSWYGILSAKASDMKDLGITHVWFPPPSNSLADQGYLPRLLNVLDSKYGTETELTAATAALNAQGIESVADIVINHRVGTTGPADFTDPTWGLASIVSNDDCGCGLGSVDSGEPYAAARDIDHSQTFVQDSLKTWMTSRLGGAGFTGLRYDYSKGYAPNYAQIYHDNFNPSFCVGEIYTDLNLANVDAHRQLLMDYINGTGQTCAAFDFTTKGLLNQALASSEYWRLKDGTGKPAGAIGWWAQKSVTFVDNHDTGPSETCATGQNLWPVPCTAVMEGYAYILTHPGIPTVYYPHVYDWNLRAGIKSLIDIRKAAGITSTSTVSIQAAELGLYAAIIRGTSNQVAMKIGPNSWSPGTGWNLASSGSNYAVWVKRTINEENLGSRYDAMGANIDFRVYSSRATRVMVYIYAQPAGVEETVSYVMTQDPVTKIWSRSVSVAALQALGLTGPVYYGYRAWGPNWPYDVGWTKGSAAGFISDVDSEGNRFNPNKVLLDPYALEMSQDPTNPSNSDGTVFASGPLYRNIDSGTKAPKGIVLPGDSTSIGTKPTRPLKDDIVYEVHVRGLTKGDPSIAAAYQGTYKGAGLKASYLASLGVTAVEFLPVQETQNDTNDVVPNTTDGDNYWGYMTLNYFAPDRRYSYDKTPGGPTREWKAMVKAFHDAGIKVFIDAVYNHTGEGGNWIANDSSTYNVISYRGLDNPTYYCLTADKQFSWDNTGVGGNYNTFNPVAQNLIVDSLAYWKDTLGVDGFRFDLASVLGNICEHGCFNYDKLNSSTALNRIVRDMDPRPDNGGTGVDWIAEPWAIGDGTYQVGNFPSGWSEWNGYYRDVFRKDQNKLGVEAVTPGQLADRFAGSSDLYGDDGRKPWNSVNFMVAHDGFTLKDLYSYNSKVNNQPWPYGPSDGGEDNNNSWDQGGVPAAQRRAARNGLAFLMLSAGTPMVTGGDEFLRTQYGNNNAYNLDASTNWLNYTLDTDQQNFQTFAQRLIAFRKAHPALRPANFYSAIDTNSNVMEQIRWFQPSGALADSGYMANSSNHAIAYRIDGTEFGDPAGPIYVAYNGWSGDVTFTLPWPGNGRTWYRVVDTAGWAEGPNQFANPGSEALIGGEWTNYGLNAGSVLLLIAKCSVASPTALTATPIGFNRIDLSWSGSAASYNVLRATTSGGPYTQIATPATASYSDTSVTGGMTYYYVVQAIGTCTSSYSSEASATALCPGATGTVSGSVTICAGSSATVEVTVSGGTAPYVVTLTNGGGIQAGPGPLFRFSVSPAATTPYSVQSLVDATGCPGSGSGSATVTVTAATPGAPTGLAATPLTAGSCGIRLAWNASSAACSLPLTYAVYRSSTSGFTPSAGNRIASCVTGTSYDDSSPGLVSGTWYYVVQAENHSSGGTGSCNSGLVSAPSIEASAFLSCGSTGNGLRLLAATFRNQEAKLQWLNPDSGCPASPFNLDIRYMTGANYPDDRAAGSGVPGLPVSQTCGASSVGSVTHLSLTNGLTYRYSAFTENTPGVWSGRKATWGQPFSTSGAEKWRYTTGATAMTPPGINSLSGGNSAVAVSNDRVLHAMVGAGTNAGEWPGSFVPYAMNAPAQARPSVIPGLTSVTGHDRVVYTGAQDGRLYAFDAATGQMFASTPTALGESIQGSVTGVFTQFGGAVNRVFAATRNASGDNKVFGRNASDLSAVWEFGSGLGIGPINGDVFVDYGGQKVYFASRAGTSSSTVWCVTFIAGIACPSWVPPALGDIDSSPYVENGIVYVGNNSGSLHALNGTTGAVLWSFAPAVPDGSVKSFVWVDVPGNRAFYSTTNNVWAINLTSHSLIWQKDLTGLAPSAPLVVGTKLYVGLSNGKLLEVDTTAPGTTKEVQLESGTAIGEPGYDFWTQVIYVGSESGVVHAVQVPLP